MYVCIYLFPPLPQVYDDYSHSFHTHTFEGWQFLELPVIAEAKARGALPLLLFDRGLRSRLFPLQQLCGGRHTIAALPVRSLWGGEKLPCINSYLALTCLIHLLEFQETVTEFRG